MSKRLLMRFYNMKVDKYGEPFAICEKGYHTEKFKWSERGLIVEKIGTTDWPCNNHKNHAKYASSKKLEFKP